MSVQTSIQNNFIGGLKTEFTGLNFPENAATDTDNCVFSLIGEVSRREGINFEADYQYNVIGAANSAINTYRWRNVGGDGETEVIVVQIGNTLYFFETDTVTATTPVSTQLLGSNITISTYQASGNTNTVSQTECQFADGNGYLIVYHPDCDPFYCSYASGVITATLISVQIRDYVGINDSMQSGNMISIRPPTLSTEHQYNLQNQGWTTGQPWSASTTTGLRNLPIGSVTFDVQTGITGIENGQTISIISVGLVMGYATVTSYNSGSGVLVLNVYEVLQTGETTKWLFTPIDLGFITTWFSAEGTYPSNADQWWVFKDDTGTFNPATTAANITLNAGQAPQGYYIFSAWNQNRTQASGIAGLTTVQTATRPRTGCWFQGRVFYAGADASQPASGDANFYTWTENIYFSQIITPGNVSNFGACYQINDPTSENLNSILPSDGGVIVVQGCGAIYKLFPITNGIIVFAQNGTYFVTGSTGIGFTATDYTITQLKTSVQCISGTSFVDVQGMPVFWNEEGIYRVVAGQNGLDVQPLTIGTILSFYNSIPKDSKSYARGTYNPLNYVVTWIYRSTEENGIGNRYQFDSALNMRVIGPKGPEVAFYPYSISNNNACYVSGVNYVNYPTGVVDPTIKYLTIVNTSDVTFSEENDSTTWFDWFSYDNTGVNYTSYFITGYNMHGKALVRWQNNYIYIFADNSDPYAYTLQALWDYSNSGNSGRWSNIQTITNFSPNYNFMYRRHKLRGRGMSLQIEVSSVSGQPFNIIGWSMFDNLNAGP